MHYFSYWLICNNIAGFDHSNAATTQFYTLFSFPASSVLHDGVEPSCSLQLVPHQPVYLAPESVDKTHVDRGTGVECYFKLCAL